MTPERKMKLKLPARQGLYVVNTHISALWHQNKTKSPKQ